MTKFYLIRHGETEWNVQNRYQGITDIPLSSVGKLQAQAIATRMKDYEVDAIYASDLSRAFVTAKSIAKEKNLEVRTLPQLREINFGEWEGYTMTELEEIYGDDYKRFFMEPHKYPFPGEGSMEAVQMRVKKAVEIITSNHDHQKVVIVSHGGILKVLIMTLLELDLSFYKSFWLGNTSLSILDQKDTGKWVLSSLNDRCHLNTMK
ncbi:MAG: phosphoserine phosphatase [Epulopiscium sp.]|jgi:broad specificity phosphatase PhoE|uniref:Histidine phosphatase family protein n=1 Tax=Defluviitalea raffinosedens TaxID=1450156 RepID=A0A7C8HD88_9FIRM|nr:histidine phosphatase family protein [Defluviitalea raffinosedens]MBZ4667869.1 pspA [Defluviitaleaceae bacterium]MDK2788847.1 phosphoserine phosphatase [Candidatus Epulonipiscium sp.]KAE9629850.1 histidine phosphatase family protein [Defluviitalea raffinosedens]MBM7686650.1 broad specificity phosphatase PhoE [Defluviitalea raffinosedens]HHW67867.1 histidine phosphatase family protein [Candidatus Epulonipiscium sp.]